MSAVGYTPEAVIAIEYSKERNEATSRKDVALHRRRKQGGEGM